MPVKRTSVKRCRRALLGYAILRKNAGDGTMPATYDAYMVFKDGSGYTGGEGALDLEHQLLMFEKFKAWHPDDIHFVIRRPDHRIIAFFHPLLDVRDADSSGFDLLRILTVPQFVQVSACIHKGKR